MGEIKKMFKDLLDGFDCNKIHKVMTLLDWPWVHSNGEVPSVLMIRENARRLLNNLKNSDKDSTSYSNGGLTASRWKDEEGVEQYSIEFVLTKSETS